MQGTQSLATAQPGGPEREANEEARARALTYACRKDGENRYSDLCAQWKAADSAEDSAVWTRLTGIFTAIGLGIGAVTTVAAIAAAVFAALASGHTRDGARAAWATEKVSRESAERQLRAYVGIESIGTSAFSPGKPLHLWLRLINRGQTPARRIQFRLCIVRCTGVSPDAAKVRFMQPDKLYDLGPGQQTGQRIVVTSHDLSDDQVARLRNGEVAFLVAGYISYLDAFAITRRVIFRCVFGEDSLEQPDANGVFYVTMSDKGVRSS